MIEIAIHTPLWVYVVFVGLLWLGWVQSKDRLVSYRLAFVMPILMFFVSIFGIASSFGLGFALLGWCVGMTLSMALSIRLRVLYDAIFVAEKDAFAIKGSFLWLGIFMAIFWLKYAVGFSMAKNFTFVFETWFVVSIGVCYGVLSGFFLTRAVILWKIGSKK